jgi:serine protease Do
MGSCKSAKYLLFKLLVFMLLTGIVFNFTGCTSNAPKSSNAPQTNPVTPYQSSTGQNDFVNAVSSIISSVVTIEVSYGQGGLRVPGQGRISGASGTGWVLDSSGLIVTNDHVVANAQTITVITSDNRTFTAANVKTDPQNDLAVIKIKAQNLPVASIGDSSTLVLAERLVAIGNSLDMGVRVTGGLVSRLNTTATYTITGQTTVTFNNLIETDAIINPGNSGGVLIDSDGLVVGIVNAGLSGPNTDTIGFGYAIPINYAMPLIQNLKSQIQ